MMKKMRKMFGNASGFTLIEMLVVIAIIAALVALVIPMIGGVREKAAVAQDASNQATLSRQILTFAELNTGDYPDAVDSLLDQATADSGIGDVKLYGDATDSVGTLHVFLLGMGQSVDMLEPFDLADWTGMGAPGPGMITKLGLSQLEITKVFDHNAATEFPNDSTDGVTVRDLVSAIADGPSYIAILNRTDGGGMMGPADGVLDNGWVQAIYEHYNLTVDPTGDKTKTDRVAVFGIGKENSMVGSVNGGIQEAPTTTRFDLNDYYGRYLALYLSPNKMGGKAKFLGVLDPRGRLIGENQKEFASAE